MGLIYEVAIIMTKKISKCLEIRQHAFKNPQVSAPHTHTHTGLKEIKNLENVKN